MFHGPVAVELEDKAGRAKKLTSPWDFNQVGQPAVNSGFRPMAAIAVQTAGASNTSRLKTSGAEGFSMITVLARQEPL
jgi:hypothetical protein